MTQESKLTTKLIKIDNTEYLTNVRYWPKEEAIAFSFRMHGNYRAFGLKDKHGYSYRRLLKAGVRHMAYLHKLLAEESDDNTTTTI